MKANSSVMKRIFRRKKKKYLNSNIIHFEKIRNLGNVFLLTFELFAKKEYFREEACFSFQNNSAIRAEELEIQQRLRMKQNEELEGRN